MKDKVTVRIADIEFEFSVETPDLTQPVIAIETTSVADLSDTYLAHFSVSAPDHRPFALRDLSIKWSVPIIDMHGLYFGGNPGAELSYLPFWRIQKQTCVNRGLPYLALIHRTGENRAAFGVFDQLTETQIEGKLSEATRSYTFQIQKPANNHSAGQLLRIDTKWTESLFVSKSRRPWPQVLLRYVACCDDATQPSLIPVPDHAFDPVFCTWTAIHHDVSHDWILRNARLAAELGFRSWITDDGWFIEQGRFADYSRVGDWQPAPGKFLDFKAHVEAVQALGFRYILWVAPFMVGKDSRAAERYTHLLTTGQDQERFRNLSPWREETAEIVLNLLTRLVQEYHLDGLKIDFLDSISMHSERDAAAAQPTLGARLDALLRQVIQHLLALNSDLLIEFRNSYTNLASRSYANIYRSSDVPINFTLNRWQAVMLRLLAPDRAVHLDPALWHPDEDDVNVAVHLINLIASVPMVSIELDRYPRTHLDMIRYWIGFYNAHRTTIVHGGFEPVLKPNSVPAIYFVGEDEIIVGLYDDIPVRLTGEKETIWILNASTQSTIQLAGTRREGRNKLIYRDKMGHTTREEEINFPADHLAIEVGGSIEIRIRNSATALSPVSAF